jgi:anti-sigma factor RsiW
MSLLPSCKDVTEHASDYVDRQLPLHRRLAYRMHLFICVDCRRYVEQLKLTIATLGRLPEATPRATTPQQARDIVERLQQSGRRPPAT